MIHDDKAVLEKIVALAGEGAIEPRVSRVMGLADVADAHRVIEAGGNTRGRIVLTMD